MKQNLTCNHNFNLSQSWILRVSEEEIHVPHHAVLIRLPGPPLRVQHNEGTFWGKQNHSRVCRAQITAG